jgi:hypothetical protein
LLLKLSAPGRSASLFCLSPGPDPRTHCCNLRLGKRETLRRPRIPLRERLQPAACSLQSVCSRALDLFPWSSTTSSTELAASETGATMDAFSIFRQGLTSVTSRPPQQHNYFAKPRIPAPPAFRDDLDSDSPQRTAHTLTACCRCRQVGDLFPGAFATASEA